MNQINICKHDEKSAENVFASRTYKVQTKSVAGRGLKRIWSMDSSRTVAVWGRCTRERERESSLIKNYWQRHFFCYKGLTLMSTSWPQNVNVEKFLSNHTYQSHIPTENSYIHYDNFLYVLMLKTLPRTLCLSQTPNELKHVIHCVMTR